MNMTPSFAGGPPVTRLAAALITCLAFAHSGQALAFKTCGNVKLMDASGVIGQKHHYTFSGTCSEVIQHTESFSSGKTLDLSYVGTANWDRKTGAAKETLKFSGGMSFVRLATGVCTNDPFLKNPPGGAASCNKLDVKADNFAPGATVYNFIMAKHFVGAKQLDLVLAQGLSAENAQKKSQPPAVPPPPKTKPKPAKPEPPKLKQGGTAGAPQAAAGAPAATAAQSSARAGLLNIEAELLATPGKFQLNGGRVVMQPMATFGPGWSGGRQLFWSGGATGAVLDLLVDIPVSATYAVELYLTRAPDYANLRVEIDGKAAALSFKGFAPKVMAPGPTQAGRFSLQAGVRRFSFMVVGKQPQSTNYFVGIDRIRLYPVGEP